jgi:transposase
MSYSEELTKEIVDEYVANPTRETVEEIAKRIGKSTRSVIAKLAAAGVYQTPKRTTKTGEAIVKKETLTEEIGSWLGIEIPTLAKTGKLDLKRLHSALAQRLGIEISENDSDG